MVPSTTSDVEALAKEAAGNWRKFESFSWHFKPEDADQWCLVSTHNRDSGLMDQSNTAAIAEEMKPFVEPDDGDAMNMRSGHWLCGWVDGYAIRVYRDGKATDAFRKWCELQERLANYPLLDEEDYSKRQHEAALEHIADAGRRMVIGSAPEDWPGRVFSWLWDNEQEECEDHDDKGAYPSEESVRRALADLELCQADELPYTKYPSHVNRTLMLRLEGMTDGDVRATLRGVMTALLDWPGRPVSQVEDAVAALRERGLWPED
jgi:hypothetical protein